MQVTLTIIRYPPKFIPAAILAMAAFRFPLWINKDISFFKLMGTGKNGTFDKHPDWHQWAILSVRKQEYVMQNQSIQQCLLDLYGSFITGWIKKFSCETFTIFLEPLQSHGSWDGKKPFGETANEKIIAGPIAVLTRATIHINKLKYFWQNVPAVESLMHKANGFIYSAGIGEMPWIKQATFSIWKSKEDMMNFAYSLPQHRDVIKKTREQKWYKEEMFSRFAIQAYIGSIKGKNPLEGFI